MSYILELPRGPPLPASVRRPPYALFGIKGTPVYEELPKDIPANLVVGFAPKAREWAVRPPPEQVLSREAINLGLRKPHVKFDIQADITTFGLCYVVTTMMREISVGLSGYEFLPLTPEPTIEQSIEIHQAWMAFELNPRGALGLDIHMQTRLMLPKGITLNEMKAVWEYFPHDSMMVKLMGHNFIHATIRLEYTHPEISATRHWYLSDRQRWIFFTGLEDKFPKFQLATEKIFQIAQQAADARIAAEQAAAAAAAKEEQEARERSKGKGKERADGKKRISRSSSRHSSKERKARDVARKVQEWMRSEEGAGRAVETPIWNPQTTPSNTGESSSSSTAANKSHDEHQKEPGDNDEGEHEGKAAGKVVSSEEALENLSRVINNLMRQPSKMERVTASFVRSSQKH